MFTQDLEAIGNIILCLMILGAGTLFVWVNINYNPDDEDK